MSGSLCYRGYLTPLTFVRLSLWEEELRDYVVVIRNGGRVMGIWAAVWVDWLALESNMI